MRVKADPVLREKFLDALKRWNGSRVRRGVHVSDLVFCLREAFFRRFMPVEPSLRQLGFFVDGARRHRVLQELLGVKCEVEVEKYGVVGHVDMLLDAPVEIKTTRAKKALPNHYFRQLGYYAVMLDIPCGYLVIQRLNNKENPWEFIRVEWSDREFQLLNRELKFRADLFRLALNQRDYRMLPRVGADAAWKCRSCPYRSRCFGGIEG